MNRKDLVHALALDLAASDAATWNRFKNSETVLKAKKLATRMRTAASTVQRVVRAEMPRLARTYTPLTKGEILAQIPQRPYIDCGSGDKAYLPNDPLPKDYDLCVGDRPATAYGRNARLWTCGLLRSLLLPEKKKVQIYYLTLHGPRYAYDAAQLFEEGRAAFARSALRCVSLRRVSSFPNSNFMNNNERNAAIARGDLVEATFDHRGAAMPMDISLGDDDDDMDARHHLVGHDAVVIVFAKPVVGNRRPVVKSHPVSF